jgi:hypothetical protein
VNLLSFTGFSSGQLTGLSKFASSRDKVNAVAILALALNRGILQKTNRALLVSTALSSIALRAVLARVVSDIVFDKRVEIFPIGRPPWLQKEKDKNSELQ